MLISFLHNNNNNRQNADNNKLLFIISYDETVVDLTNKRVHTCANIEINITKNL